MEATIASGDERAERSARPLGEALTSGGSARAAVLRIRCRVPVRNASNGSTGFHGPFTRRRPEASRRADSQSWGWLRVPAPRRGPWIPLSPSLCHLQEDRRRADASPVAALVEIEPMREHESLEEGQDDNGHVVDKVQRNQATGGPEGENGCHGEQHVRCQEHRASPTPRVSAHRGRQSSRVEPERSHTEPIGSERGQRHTNEEENRGLMQWQCVRSIDCSDIAE